MNKTVVEYENGVVKDIVQRTVYISVKRVDGRYVQGSGVIVDVNKVLTASHVIRDYAEIVIYTYDGRRLPVLKATDWKAADLAVIELSAFINVSRLKIAENDPKLGILLRITGLGLRFLMFSSIRPTDSSLVATPVEAGLMRKAN
jgi:hypothetical protein